MTPQEFMDGLAIAAERVRARRDAINDCADALGLDRHFMQVKTRDVKRIDKRTANMMRLP